MVPDREAVTEAQQGGDFQEKLKRGFSDTDFQDTRQTTVEGEDF